MTKPASTLWNIQSFAVCNFNRIVVATSLHFKAIKLQFASCKRENCIHQGKEGERRPDSTIWTKFSIVNLLVLQHFETLLKTRKTYQAQEIQSISVAKEKPIWGQLYKGAKNSSWGFSTWMCIEWAIYFVNAVRVCEVWSFIKAFVLYSLLSFVHYCMLQNFISRDEEKIKPISLSKELLKLKLSNETVRRKLTGLTDE